MSRGEYGRKSGAVIGSDRPGSTGTSKIDVESFRYRHPLPVADLRRVALRAAMKVFVGTRSPDVAFRIMPWGNETTILDQPIGLDQWQEAQARDPSVMYAATFHLLTSTHPASEFVR